MKLLLLSNQVAVGPGQCTQPFTGWKTCNKMGWIAQMRICSDGFAGAC